MAKAKRKAIRLIHDTGYVFVVPSRIYPGKVFIDCEGFLHVKPKDARTLAIGILDIVERMERGK